MDDCFQRSSGAIFNMGLVASGQAVDTYRVEVTPVSAAQPDTTLTTMSALTSGGGFIKYSELQERKVVGGLQTVNFKVFGPPSAGVTESFDFIGAVPTTTPVGQSQDYTVVHGMLNTASGASGTASASYRDTLVSIGPLQTAGKAFPFVCQIDRLQITLSGKVVNLRSRLWIAPKFGVVRVENDLDRPLEASFELTKVIKEPD